MRHSVVFIFIAMLAAVMSGCILSKTPKTNDVGIQYGQQQNFSVNVFPSATYTWTLDGEPVSNTGKSYDYTSQGGDHTLTVKAKNIFGTDTQTWHITCDLLISDLLHSMVSIPGGTFEMGSTESPYEQPVHTVTLQPFKISACEVTQAQYLKIMGNNPSNFRDPGYPDTGSNPVEQVTWDNAMEFCAKLSEVSGQTYTLPSEAQWEYACRAGSTSRYSFGDDDEMIDGYGWYWGNSNGEGGPYGTHPVGTKLPNSWGLYDMHGNVLEWCLDSWHGDYTGAPIDGSVWEPDTGSYRMVRGGSWVDNPAGFCRSAYRGNGFNPVLSYPNLGFRIVEIP
jgi:formylglycine-generating enzyme required for sulfatase activity